MSKNMDFQVLLQSIELYKNNKENEFAFIIMDQSDLIKEQSEFFKNFSICEQDTESASFTRT